MIPSARARTLLLTFFLLLYGSLEGVLRAGSKGPGPSGGSSLRAAGALVGAAPVSALVRPHPRRPKLPGGSLPYGLAGRSAATPTPRGRGLCALLESPPSLSSSGVQITPPSLRGTVKTAFAFSATPSAPRRVDAPADHETLVLSGGGRWKRHFSRTSIRPSARGRRTHYVLASRSFR